MSQTTIVKCDLCGAVLNVHKPVTVPVTFLTEQTEGRNCVPYLATTTLDLCGPCLKDIVDRQPLTATGAMGNNTYTWRDDER